MSAKQNPINKKCLNCQNDFLARRGTAKFCSPNCRKAWSRRPEKIDSEVSAILIALSNLKKYGEKWTDLQPYIDTKILSKEVLESFAQAKTRLKS